LAERPCMGICNCFSIVACAVTAAIVISAGSAIVRGLIGRLVGLAIAVIAWVGLHFVLWLIAPSKQLNDARTALRALLTPTAVVEKIAIQGPGRDILLPASGGQETRSWKSWCGLPVRLWMTGC
jgi:hypothetical protein